MLRQRGIDIRAHTAAQFDAEDAAWSDAILTMTGAHESWVLTHFPVAASKVSTIAAYATGKPDDIPDALGESAAVLTRLDRLVEAAILKATKP